VSLKHEGGLWALPFRFAPDGVECAEHPGFANEEEEEEDERDDNESHSESRSRSDGSGSASESDAPGADGSGDERSDSKDPSGEEGDESGDERTNSKDPSGEERSGVDTAEEGKGDRSAAESRKRKGAVNRADERPAQKPKLTTRGGKAGVTASDRPGTPAVQDGGHTEVSQEASIK
jgi:hypothetical protein